MVLLLSVVSSGEAPMLVDSVDGGMKHQLATNTTLWSDMIIFSSVTPSKVQSLLHIIDAATGSLSFSCLSVSKYTYLNKVRSSFVEITLQLREITCCTVCD